MISINRLPVSGAYRRRRGFGYNTRIMFIIREDGMGRYGSGSSAVMIIA